MKVERLQLLLIALAACAAAPVAASTSTAQIENIQFRVVDLDLHDGVDASFEVLSGKGSGRATYIRNTVSGRFGGWSQGELLRTSMPFASLSFQGRRTGFDAAVTFDAEQEDSRGGFTVAYACNNCRIVLAPNTRLEITGNYGLNVQDSGVPRQGAHPADSAIATALVSIRDTGHVYADLSASIQTVGDNLADNRVASGDFAFDVSNFADRAKGNVFMSIGAESTVFGSTIPEPQTYAMMLAGLAMVATVVRRRRKVR
jgi:PEP-CTERM motif